jgi:hypothetical protein
LCARLGTRPARPISSARNFDRNRAFVGIAGTDDLDLEIRQLAEDAVFAVRMINVDLANLKKARGANV